MKKKLFRRLALYDPLIDLRPLTTVALMPLAGRTSTPGELTDIIGQDMQHWGGVIRKANIPK